MGPLIKEKVTLSDYTTFGIGGPAEFFAVANAEEDIAALASMAFGKGQPVHILGGGSNILVRDEGVKGLVIKNEIKGITQKILDDNVLVTAGAGEEWDSFVKFTVQEGWWGLENLSAIPGTVGATPIQNVGAYGVEVGNLIQEVRVYSLQEQKFLTMSQAECQFGYRDSIFKSTNGQHLVVVSVTYALSKTRNPQIHYKDLADYFASYPAPPSQSKIRSAVIEIRSRKFPDWKQLGTAGSFFKNPIISAEHFSELSKMYEGLPGYPTEEGMVKVSLGWLLDKVCGLRGAREGKVGTYEKQSLVMINFGGASEAEVTNFAETIKNIVFQKTKIEIEMEPLRW